MIKKVPKKAIEKWFKKVIQKSVFLPYHCKTRFLGCSEKVNRKVNKKVNKKVDKKVNKKVNKEVNKKVNKAMNKAMTKSCEVFEN